MIKEFVKRQERACALQWDGTEERLAEMRLLSKCVPSVNFKKIRPPMRIPQPNGTFQYVQMGDWLIRGDTGSVSVMPDPLFRMRYAPVEEDRVDVTCTPQEPIKINISSEEGFAEDIGEPHNVAQLTHPETGETFQPAVTVSDAKPEPAVAFVPGPKRRGRPRKGDK